MPGANWCLEGKKTAMRSCQASKNHESSTGVVVARYLRGVVVGQEPLPGACAARWAMTTARNFKEAGSWSGGLSGYRAVIEGTLRGKVGRSRRWREWKGRGLSSAESVIVGVGSRTVARREAEGMECWRETAGNHCFGGERGRKERSRELS